MNSQDNFYDSIVSGISTEFCGKPDHTFKTTVEIEEQLEEETPEE